MTERKENLKNNSLTSCSAEVKLTEKNNLTKIQGILTSGIRTKASTDTPYYCFFRTNSDNKHSLTECQQSKCQECEIPIIFRIESNSNSKYCKFLDNYHHLGCEKKWIKPKFQKGEQVLLTGNWAKSDHSSRPSFTVYYYQILATK